MVDLIDFIWQWDVENLQEIFEYDKHFDMHGMICLYFAQSLSFN